MTLEEHVEKHYLALFGSPTREAEYLPAGGPLIRIWKWDASSTKEGVALYATLGACSALSGDQKRCEFFVGLLPEVDEVAETLAEVALHGVGTGRPPAFGDTVTMAEPLWPKTPMQSLLFASRGSEILPDLAEPVKVGFIQLVPLHRAECDFKKRHGEAELWEAF